MIHTSLTDPAILHSATPITDVLRGVTFIASCYITFGILRIVIARQIYPPYRALMLGVFFAGITGLASPLRLGVAPSVAFYPFTVGVFCLCAGVWKIRIERRHRRIAIPVSMDSPEARAVTDPDKKGPE